MKTHHAKSIRRLVFASDHNTVADIARLTEKTEIETAIRPTLTTVDVMERCLDDGLSVVLLTNTTSKSAVEDAALSVLPEGVDVTQLPAQAGRALSSSELVELCVGFAATPDEVLVVAADRSLRAAALYAGMIATAHPAMVDPVMRGEVLQFAKLEGAKNDVQRLPDICPYFVETLGATYRVYASVSGDTLAEAVRLGVDMQLFQVDTGQFDFLFAHIDRSADADLCTKLANKKVLAHDGNRILIALDADEENDTLAVHGEHGHFWYLQPNPELFAPAPFATDGFAASAEQVALLHSVRNLDVIEHLNRPDIASKLELLFPGCPMTASEFQTEVDRYSGVAALDGAGAIASREVRHPDNPRVVTALLKDLRDMGYCAWTHSFNVAGQVAKNVIAELPGQGYFQLNPAILAKIRQILDQHRRASPVAPWLDQLEEILGNEWSRQLHRIPRTPTQLRRLTELQLGIYQMPWHLCPVAGFGAKLVVVGCHLDSTAASSGGFDPATDPAPGADDDASGIAGTLATAKFLTAYKNKLRHTVRFCFFNAEELGMVGSQAYAAHLKSINTNVKAVVCMDMIGYNSDANHLFEVHAGYTDSSVRDISVPVANRVAASAAQQGQLAPAQIYKGTIGTSSSNRDTHDGAINRSDHASFHQQGYPAVVVSEDFFMNQSNEPGADSNPNYHRTGDTFIDSNYGADIACAVAHAVKVLAT